jgi:hypothetical protein
VGKQRCKADTPGVDASACLLIFFEFFFGFTLDNLPLYMLYLNNIAGEYAFILASGEATMKAKNDFVFHSKKIKRFLQADRRGHHFFSAFHRQRQLP